MQDANFELDYEDLVMLDSEDLAEVGILEAYDKLLPKLGEYLESPRSIKELLSNGNAEYSVESGGKIYEIYSPSIPEVDRWGNATFSFFKIINDQLKDQAYKFYAFNSGNDLSGMFLTEDQYKQAISSISTKTDWPYIPTLEKEWYGQQH